MELTRDQRLYLRAQAHGLAPVVMIGSNGLTEAVLREIAVNLDAHELIKVRVLGDDRVQRETWLAEICAALDCSPVQHIGKLLVLYRPCEDGKLLLAPEKPAKAAAKTASTRNATGSGRESPKRPTTRKPAR